MKRSLLVISILLAYYLNINAQSQFPNFYFGSLYLMGQEIQIELDFTKSNDSLSGKINIPMQAIKGMKLKKLSQNSNKLYFEILDPPQNGIFDGIISADSITGSFQQVGIKGRFNIKIAERPIEDTTTVIKPYIEEEVSFTNGDIKLAGTLSYPFKEGNFPAVILITGSGAQNRDEEIVGFKLFGKIADYLTRNGIAVLRCDDRGVGGSTGNVSESTTEDFATDVLAGVEFLKTKQNIDKNRIGLFGHSEGGIVAPIAASQSNDVKFIILMSGPGVPGDQIINHQIKKIMQAEGAPDSIIERESNANIHMIKAFKQNLPIEELKEILRQQSKIEFERLSAEDKKNIADINATIESTTTQKLMQMNNNWFRFFVNYDPGPTLQNVSCPVLVLFGGKDTQVDIEQNRAPIENNLKLGGNNKFETVVFPDANHLYQSANTGGLSEYAKLKKEFVPGFLEKITSWILER